MWIGVPIGFTATIIVPVSSAQRDVSLFREHSLLSVVRLRKAE